MKTSMLVAGAIARGVPFDSAYGRALAAWASAMDDADAAEAALADLREMVRAARIRCAGRARRAYDASAAGQEAFARLLHDAAHADEVLAWEGEARIAEAERSCAALRVRCDDLDAAARREAERQAGLAGGRAGGAPGTVR
jgi:hypothetical protein